MAAGRIRGITIEIGGDTTKLESALKSVDSNIRKTQSSLKDVNKLLKLDPTNTELLTQKQKLLGQEINDVKDRLKTLKDTAANVTPDDIGQEKYDALQREIIDTEQKLKNLESQARSAGSVLGSQMQAAGEKIKDVGGKVTELGTNLTQKLTVPLVAVGGVGVAKFAEVDKTMQLTNATMGNTETQAQALSDAMKDAAANSVYGMDDAATATLNFARAGLTAEEAAAALAPAMNLAAGEGGNLDTVSAGLTATINGFGGSFDEAGDYADVFANACNNSALNIDSLSSSMSTAAPVFSAAGYSVQDAALYMGTMANAGIGAEEAANSLKTGLTRLVDPTDEAKKQLEELGISVTNADGSMKDSKTVQKDLHNAFSKLSESEKLAAASTIFGKNQMDKWLALIETSPSEVGELSSALETQGTTTEMASAMMSGFGGSLEKLKSSVDVLMTSLGEALAPTIEKVAAFLQNLVDKFNALTPAQQQTIATIGLVVAAIGPVIAIIGGLITTIGTIVGAIGSVITVLAPVIAMIGGIIGSIQSVAGLLFVLKAALLSPIGIIVALVAAGVLLYKNWDKIVAFGKKLLANLKTIWNNIRTTITTVMNNIKAKVVAIWNTITSTVTNIVTGIKNKLTSIWNNIRNTVVNVVTGIKTRLTSIWTSIKTTISNVVNGIKNKITNGFTTAKNTVSNIFTAIKNKIKSVMDGAKEVVSNAIEKIKSKFKFSWSLPKLKLPHIRITGSWSLKPPFSFPHFSIDWYKTAMSQGAIFTNPTLFGMADGKMMGAGDAGAEALVGVSSLYGMIQKAVANTGTADPDVIYAAVKAGMENANVGVYIGERQFGRLLKGQGVVMV